MTSSPPARIAIVGNSGSGKTTLARRLAERLQLEHVELDSIFHQPGWTPLEPDEFRRRVTERLGADGRWVTCGNYSVVREQVWARADTVVWLDYSRPFVMKRVIRRTFRRVLKREVLWNGNREPFRNLYRWKPEENIMRWAWTQHDKYRRRYLAEKVDPRWSAITFHHFEREVDTEAWVESLPVTGSGR